MEPVGLIIGVLPVLKQILFKIDDNLQALPEACTIVQNNVNEFIRAIESYNHTLKTQTSLPWLPSLQAALAQALDVIQVFLFYFNTQFT